MRTIVINQHKMFINDEAIVTKVEHMAEYGYGSIWVDGISASYESDVATDDGDKVIFIHVGDDDEDEA